MARSGYQVSSSGSVSTTAASVAWGPDFGESADNNTRSIGVNLAFPSIALEHSKTVRTQLTMPSLDLQHSKSIGVDLTGTVSGAPFWQSVRTAVVPSSTSINVFKPTGTVEGDLLVAFVGIYTAVGVGDVNTPSGWNSIRTDTVTNNRVRSFYKTATASEPASYTFTFTATQDRASAEAHRINATHATTPIDAHAGATVTAADLDPDPSAPAVTTVSSNCLVLAYLYHDHGVLNNTHTAPANHVERTDFETAGAVSIHASTSATRVFATAGSQAAVEFNCTEATGTDGVMQRVAIAPGVLTIA